MLEPMPGPRRGAILLVLIALCGACGEDPTEADLVALAEREVEEVWEGLEWLRPRFTHGETIFDFLGTQIGVAQLGKDPWGNRYVGEDVGDGKLRVISWGPDGQKGTEDDIVYPPRK